jgi:phage-related protein
MASKKTIWDLALNISGKGTEASQAIRTVKKQLEDLKAAAGQAGKDWKEFTGNAKKLALGFAGGAAAATAGVVAMANSFAEAGDKAAKTSAALGIGAEAYQELSYAMGQSGLSAQEFDSALEKFNLTVRQGAAGNEAMQKQLAAVGLSASKLAGMKPEQAMERLSDYMKSLPDDAKRTQAAVTLFGKTAGPKMMAAMAQGSEGLRQLSQEARDLGIVISDEQAKQSEEYVSAKTRLVQSFTGMKNQFIGGAIGPLAEAFDHLKDAVVEQMPAIRELGKNFGQWLGEAVKRLPEIIAKIKEFAANVWDNVSKVKDFLGGWKNLAKMLAGLAIAPAFISGLKTAFSFGNLIHETFKKVPNILGKGGKTGALAFAKLGAAALPIIGIIAGIAAVIYTVVKNFDALKQYALDCFKRIAQAFSGGTGEITIDWKMIKEAAVTVLAFIEKTVLVVIKTAMNAIASAIQIAVGAFKVLWGVVQTVWAIIETGIKIISALFRGDLSGVIEAVSSLFARVGNIGRDMFDGLWAIASGIGDFFKNFFKDIFEYIKFFGVDVAGIFNNIKSSVTGVTDWFKRGFSNAANFVKGLPGNVSNAFGNAFTKIQSVSGTAAEFIKNGFGNAVTNIKGFAGSLGNKFLNIFTNIKNKAGSGAAFISDAFFNGLEAIKTRFPELGAVADAVAKAIQNILSAASGAAKGVFQALGNAAKLVFWPIETAIKVIAGLFTGGLSGAVEAFQGQIGKLGEIFSGIFGGIKTAIGSLIDLWKNLFQGGFDFINKIAGGLPEPFQKAFAGIKIIMDGFTGFWKNVFSSAISAVKNIAALLPNLFTDPMGTIKAIIGETGGFFKNVFQGAIDAVKGIIDGFAEKFGGVFVSIKEKIEGFVNFFKEKMAAVKDFFGGIGGSIGEKTGSVFGGRGKGADMPGHAAGGIFKQRHIAEIAEKGAEAVVPLNNTSQGFGIWKQAGELGGYLKTASEQSPAVSAAASVSAAAQPVKTPEPSPVMAAAARRISAGNNAINVTFTQKNTFSGAVPDKETVTQLAVAGQQAADDLEIRVKTALENIMRNRHRVSFA